MKDRSPRPSSDISNTNVDAGDVGLKVIEAAGGDPHFAEALRGMIWQEYCEVGQPFGPSEEGMFLWMGRQSQVEDGI